MPHIKGDPKTIENARKGGLAKAAKDKQAIEYLFSSYVNGFAEKYEEFMFLLLDGEELTKEQLDFMDRYERNLEFVKPKLARTDTSHSGEIKNIIETVHYGNKDKDPV